MESTTSGFLRDVYIKFEIAMDGVYVAASSGISNYVIPIAWVLLAVALLVWSLATITGKTSAPVLSWLTPCIAFMLVLHAMGAGYVQWIADPLFELPEQLAAAVGNNASNNPIDSMSNFETKFSVILTGAFGLIAKYIKSGAWGAAVVLTIIFFLLAAAGIIVMVVVFSGVVYAKIGLTIVLAVGPFFVLMLILQSTRDKFYAWLSTALYFIFYYLLCVLFIALFFSMLDVYVGKLTNLTGAVSGQSAMSQGTEFIVNMFAGGDNRKIGSVVASFMPVVFLSGIMAFMFLQLSTIAASMTSGSGGAVGQGASSLIFHASRLFGGGVRK